MIVLLSALPTLKGRNLERGRFGEAKSSGESDEAREPCFCLEESFSGQLSAAATRRTALVNWPLILLRETSLCSGEEGTKPAF